MPSPKLDDEHLSFFVSADEDEHRSFFVSADEDSTEAGDEETDMETSSPSTDDVPHRQQMRRFEFLLTREFHRCSSLEASRGISKQLLIDACRARYIIDDKEFNFESERNKLPAHFQSSLMSAVMNSINDGSDGSASSTSLALGAMMLLSQTALALVMMACNGPVLALNGGFRTLDFRLSKAGPGRWKVKATSCAHGFQQAQVQPPTDDDVLEYRPSMSDGRTFPNVSSWSCSSSSSVRRGFDVILCAGSPGAVPSVVVNDVFQDLNVFSACGLPIHFERVSRMPSLIPQREDSSWSQSMDSVFEWFWPEEPSALAPSRTSNISSWPSTPFSCSSQQCNRSLPLEVEVICSYDR